MPKKNENTQTRLHYLMKKRNLKQIDILKKCEPYCMKYDVKMNKSDISQYVSGKVEPSQSKLIILGMALNVNEAWLMGFDVPMERENNNECKNYTEQSLSPLPDNAFPYAPTRKIPILRRISAGLPLYAEEQLEGYTYTELNNGYEYFALRVCGDSMNAARIQSGDLIIVRKQNMVDNGQIAVVMVDDEDATVKRFYCDKNIVTLQPQSTNPIHRPQIYDVTKTHIRIIGLVVEIKITHL